MSVERVFPPNNNKSQQSPSRARTQTPNHPNTHPNLLQEGRVEGECEGGADDMRDGGSKEGARVGLLGEQSTNEQLVAAVWAQVERLAWTILPRSPTPIQLACTGADAGVIGAAAAATRLR